MTTKKTDTPTERDGVPTPVEDPAVVAAKKAAEAKAAWFAIPVSTVADEKTPKYKAAEKRSKEADDAFAAAPVTSLAGALTKLRALAKDITEDRGPTGWDLSHIETVTAYLQELADKTGIALIDLPAEDIARELTDKSWADRARFFNNAIVESLETLGIAVEAFDKKDEGIDTRGFLDACMLMMHGRICKVLDIWGLEVPPDEDAARVFALSASPKHRNAARVFCGTSQNAVDRLFEPNSGLTVFKRMSEITRPGLTEWWGKYIEGPKTAEPDPAAVAFTELKAAWTAFDALPDEESRAGRPESPKYVAAYERYAAARDAVRDAVPISMAGVAAKVRALLEPYRADADAVGLDHDYDISAKVMLPFLESDAARLLDAERLAGV